MRAKRKYERISTAKAGSTHHQLSVLKTLANPESSEPFDERTHTARTTRAKPMTTRTIGQARRMARRTGWRDPLDPLVGSGVAGADGVDESVVAAACAGAGGPSAMSAAPPPRSAGVGLAGPGVGEPLPGQLQGLGHHACLGHRGHEVC